MAWKTTNWQSAKAFEVSRFRPKDAARVVVTIMPSKALADSIARRERNGKVRPVKWVA